MVAETRALRALVWQEARLAWKPRQLHASLCKFHATDRAQRVCEMAMDLLAEADKRVVTALTAAASAKREADEAQASVMRARAMLDGVRRTR